jgi:hypothetical protein
MTVRHAIEGTLAMVVLVVLILIGWQTTILTTDITNVKAAMLTRHDLVEASKEWNASKEGDAGRATIRLANDVTPVALESAKEPPLAPQITTGTASTAGPAARGGELGGSGSLKGLSDDLERVKQDLADVRASADSYKRQLAEVQSRLEANIESTNIARLDLGHIVKKDSAGAPIVSISDLMQSAQFRAEFRSAVDDVVQPRLPSPTGTVLPQPMGTIRIVNRMGTSQFLEVNGVGRWISPLSSQDVVVPPGVATTRLTGYEAMKSWPLNPGNSFFQSVLIEPQPTPIIYY